MAHPLSSPPVGFEVEPADSNRANIFLDEEEEAGEDPGELAVEVAEDDGYEKDDDLRDGPSGPPALVYTDEFSIDGLMTRDELIKLVDKDKANKPSDSVARTIEQSKSLLFMPNDIVEHRRYEGDTSYYEIHMFGPLIDGSKAHVVLTDIMPFFDVWVPDRPAASKKLSPAAQERLGQFDSARVKRFELHLQQIAMTAKANMVKIESGEAIPCFGYNESPCPYKRLVFRNLQDRRKALDAVRENGYATASDDRSSHYRKIARERGITLCNWLILSKYEYTAGYNDALSPQCAHYVQVSVDNVKSLCDPLAPPDELAKGKQLRQSNELLKRDRTLVMGWDIETHTWDKSGDVPRAERQGDAVFAICASFHWKDDPTPIWRVAIVDVPTAPDSRWQTIVCGSPKNVLMAFSLVWKAKAPDIVTDFNGSNYDYQFVVGAAMQYGILALMFANMSAMPARRNQTDDAVMKWNYQTDKKIKITAEESMVVNFLKVPGSVPIDVRVCFKKLYPKSEVAKGSSLAFYLGLCGMAGKADLPIKRMWRYYRQALALQPGATLQPDLPAVTPEVAAEQMRATVHYCGIDSARCPQLLIKRSVIPDARENGDISFVSMLDTYLYAGGMRVRNMLIAYAVRRKGMLCSNIGQDKQSDEKYPGALVIDPIKELHDDRPITGLDAASLYPSIIITYNLSPEKIFEDPALAHRLKAAGKNLHEISFKFGGDQHGWAVRHDNKQEEYGLYPTVLLDLFSKRKLVKKQMGPKNDRKELIELIQGYMKQHGNNDCLGAFRFAITMAGAERDRANTNAENAENVDTKQDFVKAAKKHDKLRSELTKLALEYRLMNVSDLPDGGTRYEILPNDGTPTAANDIMRADYEELCFELSSLDSVQKAIKVQMNTFYGEAGNQLSAFFLLLLAGAVTSGGQYTLKSVHKVVSDLGYRVVYGDTDSLYLKSPEVLFVTCDAEYKAKLLLPYEEKYKEVAKDLLPVDDGNAASAAIHSNPTEIERLFNQRAKLAWWTAMVRITMSAIEDCRARVNEWLERDNGTKHLTFAYEEVGFPTVMAGKKKYWMIPHVDIPNFFPKKLFVRGIDIIKQGQPGLVIDIGSRIMWASMSVSNTRTLRQITEDVLAEAVTNAAQWEFKHFVRTDAWKPDKNNVRVQRFIARMKVRHMMELAENDARRARNHPALPTMYDIPEAGERFRYVLVMTGAGHDLRGYKSKPKKGDMMEYAHVAEKLGLDIDVAEYLSSYVVGLCARFINYHPDFQPPGELAKKLPYKQRDKYSQDRAKKHLELRLKQSKKYDPKVENKRGYAYRRAYKNAAAELDDAARGVLGAAASVLVGDSTGAISYELFLGDSEDEDDSEEAAARHIRHPITRIVDRLARAADTFALTDTVLEDDRWSVQVAKLLGIEADGSDANSDGKTSRTLFSHSRPPAKGAAKSTPGARAPATGGREVNMSLNALDHIDRDVRAELAGVLPAVTDMAIRYEAALQVSVRSWRQAEIQANPALAVPEDAVSRRGSIAAAEEAAAAVAAEEEAAYEEEASMHADEEFSGEADANADAAPEVKEEEAKKAPPSDSAQALSAILTPEDQSAAATLSRLWRVLLGISVTRKRAEHLDKYLARLRNRRVGVAQKPTHAEVGRLVAAGAEKAARGKR
jgi:DNA polymerase elongation subunit (family B)